MGMQAEVFTERQLFCADANFQPNRETRTPAAPQESISEYTGNDTGISVVLGHDLSRAVTSWDKLPAPLRAAILAIVDTAGK
jgi:hypothetical protein